MSGTYEQKDVNTGDGFQLGSALKYLGRDTVRRVHFIHRRALSSMLWFVAILPKATASAATPQTPPNNTDPALRDDVTYLAHLFSWRRWSQTASDIRKAVGSLESASTNGSSGALTLLPTAGALIGPPTKELWVVYKLMPLAGILSIPLSLGGNIVPTEVHDYELNSSALSYGGMVATNNEEMEDEMEDTRPALSGAQAFAAKVDARSQDMRGGTRYVRVWYGIALQLFWLGVLLGACWFTRSGSILVWWCKNWGWMFFWYLMVACASLLENFASVPFTRQWTLRVSRAPKVRISDDAPIVRLSGYVSLVQPSAPSQEPTEYKANDTTPQSYEERPFVVVERTASTRSTEVLDALESGLNCKGQVVRDQSEPWSSSRVPFYVIISLEGVSGSHAVLRVVSKAISVGVFAAGTAMFASAQLITISVALTVLCLILGAGVFGRVVALWMASEMMKTKPVLHRVVKSKGSAAEYINQIFNIEGLVVEVMGHVVVNGRCIAR